MTEDEAREAVDILPDLYGDRIVAALDSVRGHVAAEGWETTEVVDIGADEYRWDFTATAGARTSEPRVVGVSITIREAVDYDGEPLDGVTFALDLVADGGLILGGLTPYNYTPECWVHATDLGAVEGRWAIIEEACASGEGLAELLADAPVTTRA